MIAICSIELRLAYVSLDEMLRWPLIDMRPTRLDSWCDGRDAGSTVNVDPFPREVTHPCRCIHAKIVSSSCRDVKIERPSTMNPDSDSRAGHSPQLPVPVGDAAVLDIKTTAGAMQGFFR